VRCGKDIDTNANIYIDVETDTAAPSPAPLNHYYTIRHGVDDYKTGKTYGERPPLVRIALQSRCHCVVSVLRMLFYRVAIV
jgi:hypothetical protein